MLDGGDGDDKVDGGKGDDDIEGGAGDDVLFGDERRSGRGFGHGKKGLARVVAYLSSGTKDLVADRVIIVGLAAEAVTPGSMTILTVVRAMISSLRVAATMKFSIPLRITKVLLTVMQVAVESTR